MQNLFFRTEKYDPQLPKQIIKYLKASVHFCKDHADKIYASCLLQLSHPFYTKFPEPDQTSLTKNFLEHPEIRKQFSDQAQNTPFQDYLRLNIKRHINSLTYGEQKILTLQMKRLSPFNWQKITPNSDGIFLFFGKFLFPFTSKKN